MRMGILNVRGIDDLMVYDTAPRIGAFLGRMPTVAYLRGGTREGARAAGRDYRQPFLALRDLPRTLWPLEKHEIEDLLCIYKSGLRREASSALRSKRT